MIPLDAPAYGELAQTNGAGEMSGHTPGPWRYAETRHFPIDKSKYAPSDIGPDGKVFWGYHITGSDQHGGMVLPTLGSAHNFPGQTEANARLIAAAPDMLAALKIIASDRAANREPTGLALIALAAIAKAEGRS